MARVRAYGLHLYTASGAVVALVAARELFDARPDPRVVFAWLALAVVIDATDGPLARRWRVTTHAAAIDGRVIDDIVDYLTFAFLPLVLVWRMGWLPPSGGVLVALALMASLFGFAHVSAKQDEAGFFRGFPSYWNVYAFYAGVVAHRWGPVAPALVLVGLTMLTVTPVRFVYPNRVPRPWRRPVLVGGAVWLVLLGAMLLRYPVVPGWLLLLSLSYPAYYVALSWHLSRTRASE